MMGCGGSSDKNVAELGERDPLHEMRYLAINGRAQEAWTYCDKVLEQHGDDPETVAYVAQIAHANQQSQRVAELLQKACELESFANEQRVNQAVVALIGVGKIMESIEMLEKSVAAQPSQIEPRRLLYDFYVGTENRPKSVMHGRKLVRQRSFDVPLLMNLPNTEYRMLESAPLAEMSKRNPNDKRPKIGTAKVAIDRGDTDAAISTCKEILQSHPDFTPAQALLCSAYASTNQLAKLESFATKVTDGIESFVEYWVAIGDWATEKELHDQAARCYWEGTRAAPDHAAAWFKLNNALQQMKETDAVGLSESQRKGIQKRATLLSRFSQQHRRFERSGKVSRELAIELAKTLVELGRLWEAEAWSAVTMTLPEDESVPVESFRKSVVAQLTKQTPWQNTDDFPELSIDLRELPIGNFAKRGAPAPLGLANETSAERLDSDAPYRLTNEANKRGLEFFGRTDDDLDEPGIMLHQTLGCGGGTIDFDLDGWSDLYLINAGGTPPNKDSGANALFRNLNGSFVETTGNSNTSDTNFGQGVAVGDINADGYPDMLVLNYGPNVLYLNNGDGSFSDVSEEWFGSVKDGWSTSAAIADLNRDGISDLVVVHYCEGSEVVSEVCNMEGSEQYRSCTPMKFAAGIDRFLIGDGKGHFIDKTDDWSAKPDVPGRGLGVVAGCFGESNAVNVFVANDITNNHFWTIQDNGERISLVESAMLCGLGCDDRAFAQGSMGIATGDFDRDGKIDFYVTNFQDEYNTYHHNRGKQIWQDYTKRLNLNQPTVKLVGFGSEAIDLDHDGELEIVVTNGHVDMFSRFDERSVYDQPIQIFRKDDSGRYEPVVDKMYGDYVSGTHVGRALWTIDVDRDGRQDLVITHQTEPTALLVNHSQTAGNWVRFVLRGTRSDRSAVGAVVQVTSNQTQETWTGFVTSGDGYLCSNDQAIHFGVGKSTGACTLKISWPSGSETFAKDVAVNHSWLCVENELPVFQQSDN